MPSTIKSKEAALAGNSNANSKSVVLIKLFIFLYSFLLLLIFAAKICKIMLVNKSFKSIFHIILYWRYGLRCSEFVWKPRLLRDLRTYKQIALTKIVAEHSPQKGKSNYFAQSTG